MALKTTLKAELNEGAREQSYRAVSGQFPYPTTGRIAMKMISHLGNEAMKVFSVEQGTITRFPKSIPILITGRLYNDLSFLYR